MENSPKFYDDNLANSYNDNSVGNSLGLSRATSCATVNDEAAGARARVLVGQVVRFFLEQYRLDFWFMER